VSGEGRSTGRPGRATAIALAITLVAVLVRVAYDLGQRGGTYFADPIMDARYHLEWARAFAAGETYQEGPFFRAPLYPWFLGSLLRLFGEDLLAVRLVQAALGGVTTWLTFALGRRVLDARAGLVAAALVALNWVLVYFDGELLIPTLAIPLDLAALLLTARLVDAPCPRRAGVAGLAWGVAALARPNVLLYLPLVFAWLVLRARPRWRTGLLHGLALAGGTLAPVLPITLHNALVGGDRVLISSQAGVNLWIGNNPASDGSTAIVPGTRPGWWEGYHDAIALAEQAEGRELRASEVSAHYSRRAWAWLLGEPGASLPHLAWKARLLLLDRELGNNADVHFFSRQGTPWMAWLPPSFLLLGPLGLVGAVLAWRRRGAGGRAVVVYLAVYAASIVLFFVCSRYRAPLLPVLAVLAGGTVVEVLDRVRTGRGRSALGLLLVALVLAVPTRLYPAALDTSDSMGHWALGNRELGEGRPRDAMPHLERSLAENPRNLFALRDLGAARQQSGDLAGATDAYRRALALRPGELAVASALVDTLLARGEGRAALDAALAAVAANPDLATGHDALARARLALGDAPGAEAALREGLTHDPGDFFCNLRLGALLLTRGEACAAREHLGRAVAAPGAEAQPALPQARAALEEARRACGR
jgi:4-amino-4-deoxy-L-arabinose transferase-like glycosyltransferase